MKAQTFAPLALAATTEALGLLGLDLNLPLGIDIDVLSSSGHEPASGPCDECTNVYHPPHHGIDMDDCDNDEDEGWHWVHPGKPHYPEQPKYTWGHSTVTCTETSTIIGCPDEVEYCPGRSTAYTTVTEVESTTICPVPVTTSEYHAPPATETYVHVQPTTSVHPPIKTTTIPPEEYYTESKVTGPPAPHTSVYVPGPPAETPTYHPPATFTSVYAPPPGKPQEPAPPAEEHPAPPAQEYPSAPVVEHPAPSAPAPVHPAPPAQEYPSVWVPPPAETPVVPGGNNTIPPPPAATAGAAQTVQRVGYAAFAMVAAALL
ncbi:hypothetical protein LIA77_10343 [Sarocladium implicatum]|nr:hypothetical protein LIA77_10343 [Sarocladium implicatum]